MKDILYLACPYPCELSIDDRPREYIIKWVYEVDDKIYTYYESINKQVLFYANNSNAIILEMAFKVRRNILNEHRTTIPSLGQ